MRTLEEIAHGYATDKRGEDHNYTQFYQEYFEPLRDSTQLVVEIGICIHPDKERRPFDAASLRTWRDYFHNATICGIDIDNYDYLKGEDRFLTFQGDQANREQLSQIMDQLPQPPDIIIDDGGHMMHQQQISLGVLFPFLKNGGIYVIEDLHTSYAFADAYKTPEDKSTLLMLQEFATNGKMTSPRMNPPEMYYLNENIQLCDIRRGNLSEIVFLKKK